MGKHNDREFQANLRLTFKNKLEQQFKKGVAQGAYAACKVIYDRLTDESKPADERMNNAITFCKPIIERAAAESEPAEKAGD